MYVLDTSKSRATNKKKKKERAAAEVIEYDSKSGGLGLDGRAGPRSKNVVLQKSKYTYSISRLFLLFTSFIFSLFHPLIPPDYFVHILTFYIPRSLALDICVPTLILTDHLLTSQPSTT